MWEKQTGILLQAIPYLGSHRIVKVLMRDCGLLTLIAKHVKTKQAACTSPFCIAEWVFHKTHSEIYPLKDVTLIDPLLHLKTSYSIITAAGTMASDLLHSQYPHKTSSGLYELTLLYFQHLPRNPSAISQSFRLKLLQFEGLLHLQENCMRCAFPATHLSRGESLCSSHALVGSFSFDEQEWDMLLKLGLSRRFSNLEALEIPAPFIEKTDLLFSERMA
jgi:DNA repair protein RecO